MSVIRVRWQGVALSPSLTLTTLLLSDEIGSDRYSPPSKACVKEPHYILCTAVVRRHTETKCYLLIFMYFDVLIVI